ncbi:folate-binding protein YgfZ [Pseudorhodoferax sp. Leaf265]|uniref:CAF17-like 4Fe-4S cluster assembly/insertion protein YgfZ n=1 Tax=Pseudorhodoferax sp. Leaf265 TaxID=1736315 RepID=UPI0006FB6494|nr:folate-binding protein YgfZ [Pseudorhodoferax sp. Leaf265]KQP19204.1 folate-binding protein [Pseudorhodoferax sp. Leaf265]
MQPTADTRNGLAPLTHLGVIAVQGEEAAKFLHSQLSQDFVLVAPDEARLAAFCSPKGRMQASFVGLRWTDGQVLLVCARDLLAPTLKRLSMFVMRAKAKLRDATADFQLLGALGPSAATLLDGEPAPWHRREVAGGVAVALYPADGQPRALLVLPAQAAPPDAPALPLADWQLSEVRSGVVLVTQPLFEALVPQMLNYESVGGVSFKKGCYPGQEVVARSQFRGTLKRRAYVVHADAELAAGQEVFQASDAEQPTGTVVQAAANPAGGWDAVVSVQIAAAEANDLHAGSATGPALQLQPLPYALLADV